MPRANEKETGLGRKAAALIAVGLITFGLTLIFLQNKAEAPSIDAQQVTTVLGGQKFSLEVADETIEQVNGLSGRTELEPDNGMLFVFDKPGEQCMWMKDMKFFLDIIWLDEDKEIVKIEENVRPGTYPDTFCSEVPAKYVLEVNAGVVDKANLTPGEILHF